MSVDEVVERVQAEWKEFCEWWNRDSFSRAPCEPHYWAWHAWLAARGLPDDVPPLSEESR